MGGPAITRSDFYGNPDGSRIVGYSVGESRTHPHPLPDIDAEPGTYTYADGCCVRKYRNGISVYTPDSGPAADAGVGTYTYAFSVAAPDDSTPS